MDDVKLVAKIWEAVNEVAEKHETSWSKSLNGYRTSIADAANQVCYERELPTATSRILTLMLTHAWNETLHWADFYKSSNLGTK